MMSIVCPLDNDSADGCPWVYRSGIIRDLPNYGVKECDQCKMVTHEADLREFVSYESGSMHNWAAGYGGSLSTPEEDISRRVQSIKSVSLNNNVRKILDFGSGAGEMITALSKDFTVFGLEPEDEARERCLSIGLKAYSSTDEIIRSKESFDLVTLFHVVEHFYDPFLELGRIHNLLNPGGLIILETPNSQDILLEKYKSKPFSEFTYWSHHPMLHSKYSITALVLGAGYEIVVETGVQRYGLSNHMYWLSKGLPGGHNIWKSFFSQTTENSYKDDLIQREVSDTLWVVAKKPLHKLETGEKSV